jgi:hypothetical protein
VSKIYLAITIDTECDKGKGWKVKQPLSFTNTQKGIVNNLQPILDKYSAKATYLLSPEVLLDQESVRVLKSMQQKVELGAHLHAEFIEPEANYKSDTTNSYQKDFSAQVEREKLINLTQLFKDKIGYSPTSFRAGRFGISHSSLSILEELGYLVDSSVTPDLFWKNNNLLGNSVNFYGAPYQPYYPSNSDFRMRGDMNILQVPVSVMNYKLLKLPDWIKRKITLKSRYHQITFSYLTNFSKASWLRPTFSSVEEMQVFTNKCLEMNQDKDISLCMMFHSNEFEVGTSPYSLTNEALQKSSTRLDGYLSWLSKSFDCKFVGLTEFKEHVK